MQISIFIGYRSIPWLECISLEQMGLAHWIPTQLNSVFPREMCFNQVFDPCPMKMFICMVRVLNEIYKMNEINHQNASRMVTKMAKNETTSHIILNNSMETHKNTPSCSAYFQSSFLSWTHSLMRITHQKEHYNWEPSFQARQRSKKCSQDN